jgi:hypothetical protein
MPAIIIRDPRVIGILSNRNHPAHLSKLQVLMSFSTFAGLRSTWATQSAPTQLRSWEHLVGRCSGLHPALSRCCLGRARNISN